MKHPYKSVGTLTPYVLGDVPTLEQKRHMIMSRTRLTAGGCMEYTGVVHKKKGYGSCSMAKKSISAHRLSWLLNRGEIPDGLEVCHTCDNPPCINPDHLFLGTHKENLQDASRKGRMRSAKKTPQDKALAVLALLQQGHSQPETAKKTGLCVRTVQRIQREAASTTNEKHKAA